MNLASINLCSLEQFENGCPSEVFSFLRKNAPVWYHPKNKDTPDNEGFWVISKNADVRTILRDHEHFSSETGRNARKGGGTTLFDMGPEAAGQVLSMMDPPRHDDIRKLVSQGFFPKTLALMEESSHKLAIEILEKLKAPGEINFLHDVASELPLYMICTITGLPREDWCRMTAWADAAIEYAANDPQSDKNALMEILVGMGSYAFGLIEKIRREPPNNSMFSHVVHATIPDEDGNPRTLDDIELIRFFNLLITGGTETTRNAIAGGMYALIQHPEQYEALKNNFDALSENAVEEILRWTSPVHFNRRTACEDFEFNGHVIKRGEKVTCWYPSANRDEAVFDKPFEFNIYRKNANKHVSFGYGIHHCLGSALARMEIRIILKEFFKMYGNKNVENIGEIKFIRSNRHQGVSHCNIKIY
jgi:cytochrome P450